MNIEMPTGWLSPNGELYKCGTYEHNATADEICAKMNVEYEKTWRGRDEALYALGWCKLGISSFGDHKYWVHWERPLTAYQRYFLKDYFENEDELILPMDVLSHIKYFNEDNFFNKEN